ncbi:MAG: hypothetical protein CFE43_20790 [Burkholderiales bacterium PBB3]|nr:MAG: hypothetical protein CFE43_20790 [Burkholderiales bacterium PBB3]
MNQPTTLPPEVCPLCSQPNQCAMEIERATGQKQPPCWCTQASFSAELLARIPDAARNQACICAACASASPAKQARTQA